jgi:signal transduction histidine kinase
LSIIDIITILLFLLSINYAREGFSISIILRIIIFITYLIVFDFVILLIIHTENLGITFFLSGIIILISGDFLLMYPNLSLLSTHIFSYGELLFLLGLLFNWFGTVIIYKEGDYVIKNWFRKDTAIKSKLAFWCFCGGVASFLIFFMIAYIFDVISKTVFLGLPLFIMMYSLVVVNFSLYMGKFFEMPFKQLTKNIKLQMFIGREGLIDEKFSTEEFIFLQKFITDAFMYREKQEEERLELERKYMQIEIERAQAIQIAFNEEKLKNEALHATAIEQANFKKIAAQVAHDIASPIFALQMILPRCDVLPENTRSALNKFSTRIIDITQNFLSQFKQKVDGITINGVTKTQALVYTELTEIVTEKKYEYSNRPIKFILQINPNSYFTFFNIDIDAFKRMISNLINNSVDALINKEGIITIHLDTIDDKV